MKVKNEAVTLYAAAIAGELLGTPDSSDAGHLRFGTLSINIRQATFYDNDADEGGQLIELVRKLRNGEGEAELAAWIEAVKKKENKRRADLAMNAELPDLDGDGRSVSAERELIGALILRPSLLDLIVEDMMSTDFSFPFHRDVYMTIVDVSINRQEHLKLPELIVELGGDDGAEIVPGFTATTYLVRLASNTTLVAGLGDLDERARETARLLKELAEERLNPPELDSPFESKFGAVRWEDLDAPGPEHEYLIDRILSRGDKSVTGGPKGSGKSFLAIHMAMAVARGVQFFGNKVRHGGVIYHAGEGARGVKKRLRAYRQHFGVPKRLGTFVLLTKPVDLFRPSGDTDALITEIKKHAERMPVPLELVVIDTLATATAGADENNVKDMSMVLANIAKIADACGVHVMLVHHMNAAGTKLRGSTSIGANVDQIIEVTKDEKTKVKTAVLTKQKDDEDGLKFIFKLKQIILGQRDDGQNITSCVVVGVNETEAAQAEGDRRAFHLNDGEHAFYRALVTALGEHGQPPPEGCAVPRGIGLVVHYDKVKEIFRKQNLTEETEQDREIERLKKALQRARTSLAKYNCIGADNPWIWRTTRPVKGFPMLAGNIIAQYDAATEPNSAPPATSDDEFNWR